MSELAKAYIWAIVMAFLSMFLAIVIGIIFKSVAVIIPFMIFMIIISLIFDFKFKDWHNKKNTELLNQKYLELKNKENKTLFEELFISAYNDTAIKILEQVFSECGVYGANNIDFEVEYFKNYVTFLFEYKKHKVYYHVYEHKVDYFIDSPSKYDYLSANRQHEKLNSINISIQDFNSLREYFSLLSNCVSENINSINDFEENVEVLSINDKILEEIIDYKNFNKIMGIFLNVFSVVLLLFCGILTYFCIKDGASSNIEWWREVLTVLGIIVSDGIAVFGYVYSLLAIRKSKIIENDLKFQNLESFEGKPYKIGFIVENLSYKHSRTFCCGVKLYFDCPKHLRLIFPCYFSKPSKQRKTKLIEKLINKNFKLTYCKKSKLIVCGMEKFIKEFKRIK